MIQDEQTEMRQMVQIENANAGCFSLLVDG